MTALDYRFEARFTESVEIGPVDGGARLDNHFDGTVTHGVLAGARVRGTDQVRIRADGSAEIDVRETIEDARGVIEGTADLPAARLVIEGRALARAALAAAA